MAVPSRCSRPASRARAASAGASPRTRPGGWRRNRRPRRPAGQLQAGSVQHAAGGGRGARRLALPVQARYLVSDRSGDAGVVVRRVRKCCGAGIRHREPAGGGLPARAAHSAATARAASPRASCSARARTAAPGESKSIVQAERRGLRRAGRVQPDQQRAVAAPEDLRQGVRVERRPAQDRSEREDSVGQPLRVQHVAVAGKTCDGHARQRRGVREAVPDHQRAGAQPGQPRPGAQGAGAADRDAAGRAVQQRQPFADACHARRAAAGVAPVVSPQRHEVRAVEHELDVADGVGLPAGDQQRRGVERVTGGVEARRLQQRPGLHPDGQDRAAVRGQGYRPLRRAGERLDVAARHAGRADGTIQRFVWRAAPPGRTAIFR